MQKKVSRYDIHNLLLESPMMTSKEVALLTGTSYQNARSILYSMKKAGLVGVEFVDKISRFYAIEIKKGQIGKCFRHKVYDYLMENGWKKPIEISRHFNVNPRVGRDAIGSLMEQGKVIRSDGGAPCRYKANPLVPYREVRNFSAQPDERQATCTKQVAEKIKSMGFMAAQLIKE